MRKRLQIVVDDEEVRRFEQCAKAEGLTLSSWARQALRAAEREVSVGDPDRKLAAIRAAYQDDVFPIDEPDVLLAKDIVATRTTLSARNLIHLAVMERHSLHRIFSFDQGFDSVTGIEGLTISPNLPGPHQ